MDRARVAKQRYRRLLGIAKHNGSTTLKLKHTETAYLTRILY